MKISETIAILLINIEFLIKRLMTSRWWKDRWRHLLRYCDLCGEKGAQISWIFGRLICLKCYDRILRGEKNKIWFNLIIPSVNAKKTLEQAGLPPEIIKPLNDLRIKTLGSLARRTEADLLTRGLNRETTEEIQKILIENKLNFGWSG